jgi:hypothetical protein
MSTKSPNKKLRIFLEDPCKIFVDEMVRESPSARLGRGGI